MSDREEMDEIADSVEASNSTTPVRTRAAYAQASAWGKIWVADESDAQGEWLEEGVTSETVASAFAEEFALDDDLAFDQAS